MYLIYRKFESSAKIPGVKVGSFETLRGQIEPLYLGTMTVQGKSSACASYGISRCFVYMYKYMYRQVNKYSSPAAKTVIWLSLQYVNFVVNLPVAGAVINILDVWPPPHFHL